MALLVAIARSQTDFVKIIFGVCIPEIWNLHVGKGAVNTVS